MLDVKPKRVRVRRRLVLPESPVFVEYRPVPVGAIGVIAKGGELAVQFLRSGAATSSAKPKDSSWISGMTREFLSLQNEVAITEFFTKTGVFAMELSPYKESHSTSKELPIIRGRDIERLQKVMAEVRKGGDARKLFREYRREGAPQTILATYPLFTIEKPDPEWEWELTCRPRTMLDAMAAQLLIDKFSGRIVSVCARDECNQEFTPKRRDECFCGRTCARKARIASRLAAGQQKAH